MNLKGIQLTWLGHATFRIETPGGQTIIIDPWIMNNPACPPSEKKVKKVDTLLITHGHGDHIGDAVEVIREHSPQVVGMPEMCGWLEKKGARKTAMMNKGGTQKIGDIKVTMVHADHSCGIRMGISSSMAAKLAGTWWSSRMASSFTTPVIPTFSETWRSSASFTRLKSSCYRLVITSPWDRAKRLTPAICSSPNP